MYSKPVVFGGFLLASLCCGIAHAEVDALVSDSLNLIRQGQSQQAFTALAAQEQSRAGDPDFDTTLGIAANETGQYTRAIFALERVLSVQPANSRARAELGRALFAVGDTKASRRVLMETRQDDIPTEAAASIDDFLQAIDRVEEAGRSSVKGFIEFGIGRDTNANSGPAITNVAVPVLGNIPLTLNPSGVETAATFATLAAGVSGRYVIDPRWSLIGTVTDNLRFNSGSASQFDTHQLDISGGAAYRVERNEYTVVAQAGTYRVDGNRLRDQAGLVGEWTYRFDNFRQVSSYIQYSRLSYPGQSLRDADRTVIGSSYAHQFRDGLLAYGGLYVGEEDQRESAFPQFGHKLWGVRLGVQKPFGDALAGFVTLGYEDRKFKGTDPIFLATRHDKQSNLNIGFTWIPAKGWRVVPQIAFTKTDSNIPISDFDKTVLSITARRDF